MMKWLWEVLLSSLNALLPNWVSQLSGAVIGKLSKTPLTLSWIGGSIQMLWNLLKPSGIFGGLTFVGACILTMLAVATWLRDDAIKDNDAQWQLKLTKANQDLHTQIGERNLKLQKLEQKLAEVDQALAAAAEMNRKALEKQRV